MGTHNSESSMTQPSYSTLEIIENKITECTNLIITIRDYNNPYQYITFLDSDTSTQITTEITPTLFSLSNELIQKQIIKFGNKAPIIQAFMSKYSILDHEKQYHLTKDISIDTKLNILYAESLKYSRYYCDCVLPPTYAALFRENGYCNIFAKVKTELLTELDNLIAQKIMALRG